MKTFAGRTVVLASRCVVSGLLACSTAGSNEPSSQTAPSADAAVTDASRNLEGSASSDVDVGLGPDAAADSGNMLRPDAAADSGSGLDSGVCPSLGSFSGTNPPPACFQFYSPKAFVNTPIPANPKIDPNSKAIVGFLVKTYGIGGSIPLGVTNGSAVYSHPIYYGRASDPLYTLHCTNNAAWGTCSLEGKQVHIPNGAQPAGGTDHHIGIIDQTNGNEYDMWQGQGTANGGGHYSCTYGGAGPVNGSGLGFAATAATMALADGAARPEELAAAEIHHAFFGVFACCNGSTVGPVAAAGANCSDTVCPNGQGAALGQRFMLDMTDAEILALGKDPASTAILTALAHYGIIQGDENGGYEASIVNTQPGFEYSVLGGTDPTIAYAKAHGIPSDGAGGYTLDFGSGIDWASKLVVLDPCGTAGMCSK